MKLVEFQRKVEKRWEKTDTCYIHALSIKHQSEVKRTYDHLLHMARERWFLLSVKARFAEGHIMASRISRRITIVHQKLKHLIEKYNSLRSKVLEENDMPESLNWDIVTNMQSHSLSFTTEEAKAPANIRRTAVDQTHLIRCCDEEVVLVKQEMLNTYTVLLKFHNIISQKLQLRVEDTQFSRGVITLLKSKLLFLELQLVQCHSSFAHHVDIVSPPLLARKYIFIRCPDIQTPDNVIND